MKNKIIFSIILLFFANYFLYAAGLSFGMTGAVKKTVKKLDNQIVTNAGVNNENGNNTVTDMNIDENYLQSIFVSSGTDPENDWEDPLSDTPPEGVASYQSCDLLGIDVGSDGTYLYVRWRVNGVMPANPLANLSGEQYLRIISLNLALDTDNNINTGQSAPKGTEAGIVVKIWYYPEYSKIENSAYFHANPDITGKLMDYYDGEIVRLGNGRNYVIARYRLSGLSVSAGSTVKACGGHVEMESTNYHHYSFDNFGSTFTFVIN